MKELLLINANVNRNESRTQQLTNAAIEQLSKQEEFHITELILEDMDIPPLNSERLNRRYKLIEEGKIDVSDFDLARQWREADVIVISTPLWLFTYPAQLKAYLEAVDVIGVAYDFLPDGSTKSYCKAMDLYYITTAGGPLAFGETEQQSLFAPLDGALNLGYKTIEAFAGVECHIPNLHCIAVQNLDIVPEDAPRIMQEAIAALPGLLN